MQRQQQHEQQHETRQRQPRCSGLRPWDNAGRCDGCWFIGDELPEQPTDGTTTSDKTAHEGDHLLLQRATGQRTATSGERPLTALHSR